MWRSRKRRRHNSTVTLGKPGTRTVGLRTSGETQQIPDSKLHNRTEGRGEGEAKRLNKHLKFQLCPYLTLASLERIYSKEKPHQWDLKGIEWKSNLSFSFMNSKSWFMAMKAACGIIYIYSSQSRKEKNNFIDSTISHKLYTIVDDWRKCICLWHLEKTRGVKLPKSYKKWDVSK